MKKFLFGILVGAAVGAVGVRWYGPGSAPAKAAEKPKENPLHLPPDKRTAAGVILAKPVETTLLPEVQAYGRVLDPAPLVTAVTEQEAARTALAASEREFGRTKKLFEAGGNASAQAMEAAEAAVNRDRGALGSTRLRLLASWGRELASVADVRYLTEALEKGRALVRLDVLPGDALAAGAKSVRISLPGGSEAFEAEIIGASPVADPQIQGVSFLAMMHDHALPAGVAVQATFPGAGEPQKVLAVPRSAIVYHQGSPWIYVLGEEDTFERKLVQLGRSVGDTVLVTSGAEADEQVVTAGAQQLLAAELQAGGAPDEG